jgi:hypothetical protein
VYAVHRSCRANKMQGDMHLPDTTLICRTMWYSHCFMPLVPALLLLTCTPTPASTVPLHPNC